MMIQRGNAYMGIHKLLLLVEYGLVGGFNPFETYARVKLDHLPKYIGEHEKNIWVATTQRNMYTVVKLVRELSSPLWVYLTSAV